VRGRSVSTAVLVVRGLTQAQMVPIRSSASQRISAERYMQVMKLPIAETCACILWQSSVLQAHLSVYIRCSEALPYTYAPARGGCRWRAARQLGFQGIWRIAPEHGHTVFIRVCAAGANVCGRCSYGASICCYRNFEANRTSLLRPTTGRDCTGR
jgi:hypothetical protein